jgi:dye decolorizing peroxidase
MLAVGAALLGGAAAGAVAATAVEAGTEPAAAPAPTLFGSDVVPFHGDHQAGVDTPQQAHTWFVGLDLREGQDVRDVQRLMALWTDDAVRLTAGTAALADLEKELATSPSRLTITLGLGAGFFSALGLDDARPPTLAPLPAFPVDRLDGRWPATDLLLQIGSDDVMTVSHAVRVLTRGARSFVAPVWVQRGFVRSRHVVADGTTPRNLMGQVDGTSNPAPGTPELARTVWATEGPTWWRGGTMLVLRRIRMELDTWEQLGRSDRELAVGRRLPDGSPLSGGGERASIDLDAVGADGLLVVPELAHVRQAKARDESERMLRRGYTYDDSPGTGSVSDVGLLFAAYVADVDRQFVPVQRRLAELDLMNRWTTPVGSAVYALPPGVREGGSWCDGLLG